MFARKFAIVGLVIGALGLGYTVFATPGSEQAAAPGVVLDESTGIAPIEETVAFLEDRVADRPNDHLTRTTLAAALSELGRETADLDAYARAEAVALEALQLKSDHRPAQLELAGAVAAQHRFEESRELAEQILAEDPSATEAVALIAAADLSLGHYEQAEAGYRRLALIDRNAPAVSGLVRLALDRGDHDEARDLAAEALELSERLVRRPNAAAFYHFQLGHVRFETGDVDGAVEALEAALAVDPTHVGAVEKLAFVHAATGRPEEAAQLYRQLLADGPAADLHGSYADVLRELGRPAEAEEQEALGLALALETIDSHPAERRHLAGFFFGRDPALALALAEADLAERQDAGAYDTLAWALHQLGRHQEAAEAMDQVLEIGTASASVRYHAGAIAAANGDRAGAIEHLRAALDLNPTFAPGDAEEARALLDRLADQG